MSEYQTKHIGPPRFLLMLDAVLLVVLAVLAVRHFSARQDSTQDADITAARNMLTEMESRDYNEVLSVIRQQRTDRLMARAEAEAASLREEVAVNPDSVWENFTDYVFLGDSRVVGFQSYGFLPESRVFADLGATILDIDAYAQEAAQLNPTYVYVSFGVNDVITGIWPTAQDYADSYLQHLEVLHDLMPDAQVYLLSTLPTTESAYADHSSFAEIPARNEALKTMCDGVDWLWYVDDSQLAAEHADLYGGDGIHVAAAFYPYWAVTILQAEYAAQSDLAAQDLLDRAVQQAAEEYGADTVTDYVSDGGAGGETAG